MKLRIEIHTEESGRGLIMVHPGIYLEGLMKITIECQSVQPVFGPVSRRGPPEQKQERDAIGRDVRATNCTNTLSAGINEHFIHSDYGVYANTAKKLAKKITN